MAWTAADIPSQKGRLAIVTGPGGLGYETGLALARAGALVVLAGRNPETGETAVANVRKAAPGADVRFERLDLASLRSVEAFADRMLAAGVPVDLLINNAGVMMPPQRRVTEDGFELQFGTNYLGHFALTARLLPLLRRARGSRVVNLSSISARPAAIHFDDLQFEKSYRPDPAYGQSKLAMIMFAFELERRSLAAGWGVTAIAAHPGISRTELIVKGPGRMSPLGILTGLFDPLLRQPVWKGALPTLYAATAPEAKGGGYYGPDGFQEIRGYPKPAAVPPQAEDRAVAARLWDVSETLSGVRFADMATAAA